MIAAARSRAERERVPVTFICADAQTCELDPASFDIVPFKRKSLSVHWELMFTRALYTTADMAMQHRILNEVADLVDAGVLRTTLKAEIGAINAANLRRAHGIVESGKAIGKLVLSGF